MKLKIYNSKKNKWIKLRYFDSFDKEFDKFIKEVKTFSDIDLHGISSLDLLCKDENHDDTFILLSRRYKCQAFIHFTRYADYTFVNYLYVKKSQRKRGYGKRLLNMIKADVIQLYCQPENKTAQSFYANLSFKKMPESEYSDLDRLELII